MLRIIYLGTPQFAVPTLNELIGADDFEVVAAVCQPDRPKGRGNKVEEPPVKQVAVAHNIPVFQPVSLAKSPDVVQAMRALNPDVLVMVAFGQILKEPVLKMARLGVINVHGSLLPELRGAAPINWSIINGDTVTGVTTMQTEAGLDTGPMLLKGEIAIHDEMTAVDLALEMAEVGAKLLARTLRELRDGKIAGIKQDDDKATFAPRLDKTLSPIDWHKTTRQIHAQVRGLTPWPGTTTNFRGQELKIVRTRLLNETESEALASTLGQKLTDSPLGAIHRQDGLYVKCADGLLEVVSVQPQSRAKTDAKSWANGVHLSDQDLFTFAASTLSASTPS